MDLRIGVKALNFGKKLFTGDVDHLLPFIPTVEKYKCPEYTGTHLERSFPETQGLHSAAINDFVRALASNENAGLHNIMVLRHGKVVAECSFAPYSTKFWHVTHSLCKSITGMAIAMLINEGLVSLDDKICDIFNDKCTFLTGKRMKSITVRHLLSMQSGCAFREMGAMLERDWVRAYIESEVVFEPGSSMEYNSMNSYMLSAIVTRKTGVTMSEYLRTRLFDPLGCGEIVWETCPQGITKGGWAMYIFPEDLAKLGQLYLQNGHWQVDGADKVLISEEWIQESIKPWGKRSSGEEYGYHIWPHSENGSYLFNGMFGQYVIILPREDMVILMNAGNGHLFTHSFSYDTAMTYFSYSSMSDKALINNTFETRRLNYTLSHLVFGEKAPEYQAPKWYEKLATLFKPEPIIAQYPHEIEDICARTASFPAATCAGLLPMILQCTCNSFTKGVQSISFIVEDGVLIMLWTEGNVVSRLPLGFGKSAYGIATINNCQWTIGTLAALAMDEDDYRVLKLKLCFVESSSTRLVKLVFCKNGIILKLDESPAVAIAVGKAIHDQADLASIDPVFFKDFGYIEYRINKLCAPVLNGEWV